MAVVAIPESEMRAFYALISARGLDQCQFKLQLVEHPPATFGPRVKTIKISWKNVLEAEYGAAGTPSWVDQFSRDFENGLINSIINDSDNTQVKLHPS